jgi:hypothetical protein
MKNDKRLNNLAEWPVLCVVRPRITGRNLWFKICTNLYINS